MVERGAVEEVRNVVEMSSTSEKMIGVREIRAHLAGEMSILECISRIQQNTRNYAKRQLTWFRNQTNFEPLNLSLSSRGEMVETIAARARRTLAEQG